MQNFCLAIVSRILFLTGGGLSPSLMSKSKKNDLASAKQKLSWKFESRPRTTTGFQPVSLQFSP